MIKINIGNKEYEVKEAKTQEELRQGLKGIEKLPENEGMLFYLQDDKNQVVFTMDNMKISLDIIFISDDLEVVDVKYDCKPNTHEIIGKTKYSNDVISYVLEVNPDSEIKIGDELNFLDEEDSEPVMKVLAQDGSTQMELWGGERIVSRRETKILIKKAKKANLSQKDSDFRTLGRYMFKVLKGLDTRDPEYVKSPT